VAGPEEGEESSEGESSARFRSAYEALFKRNRKNLCGRVAPNFYVRSGLTCDRSGSVQYC